MKIFTTDRASYTMMRFLTYLLSRHSTFKSTCIFLIVATFVIMIINTTLPYSLSFTFVSFSRVKTFSDYISSPRFLAECQERNVHVLRRLDGVNISVPVLITKNASCPRVLRTPRFHLPLTALLSFPGSGNTWVRHLLQQLTGIPTGAIYKDRNLLGKTFPREGRVRRVLVVKTHGSMHKHLRTFIPIEKHDRVIVIIRNVYDAILADFKRIHQRKSKHTSNMIVNTTDPIWRTSVFSYLGQWEQFVLETFSLSGPLLVLFYEDLKSDLLNQLVRTALFLSDSIQKLKEFSFCCVLKDAEGSFHRKPNNQTTDDAFGFVERIVINKSLRDIASILQETNPDVSERLLDYRKPIE